MEFQMVTLIWVEYLETNLLHTRSVTLNAIDDPDLRPGPEIRAFSGYFQLTDLIG